MASFEGGSRNPIPRWDSSASQFQRYRDEIRVFRLAENLEQSYSIAARLVSALSGPAKRVGLSLSDRELMPEYADYAAAEAEIQAGRQPPKLSKAEANDLAIKTLLSKLEKTLQPMRSQERGTRLEDFFVHRKHYRKKGMRIAEYNILWEESLERLREVDITVDSWGDLLGWLYLRGAGLSQDRYERVLCALPPDDTYPLDDLMKMLPRFFFDIHRTERSDPAQKGGGAPHPQFRALARGDGKGDRRDVRGRYKGFGKGQHRALTLQTLMTMTVARTAISTTPRTSTMVAMANQTSTTTRSKTWRLCSSPVFVESSRLSPQSSTLVMAPITSTRTSRLP